MFFAQKNNATTNVRYSVQEVWATAPCNVFVIPVSELTNVMVQVDEGPWETCAPSAATPGLYTAPWAPALLDDTSGRPDHLLKAKNKRKTTIFCGSLHVISMANAWRQKMSYRRAGSVLFNKLWRNRIANAWRMQHKPQLRLSVNWWSLAVEWNKYLFLVIWRSAVQTSAAAPYTVTKAIFKKSCIKNSFRFFVTSGSESGSATPALPL